LIFDRAEKRVYKNIRLT